MAHLKADLQNSRSPATLINPYAAPASGYSTALSQDKAEAEQIRSELISREVAVRRIGEVHYLGAVVLGFLSLSDLSTQLIGWFPEILDYVSSPILGLIVDFSLMCLAAFQVLIGRGLRDLDASAQAAAVFQARAGLYVAFPISTFFFKYFLSQLESKEGSRVFTPEYQKIRELTPQLNRRSSLLMELLIIVLTSLPVIALIGYLAVYFTEG